MLVTLTSNSPFETQEIGVRIAHNCLTLNSNKPLLLKLDGDLGAGKTHLTKGLAKGLGIKEEITSPTYAYIDEYEFFSNDVPRKLVHVDAWRIEDNKTASLLRIEELYLDQPNIILIEWGSKYKLGFSKPLTQAKATLSYISEYSRKLELESDSEQLLNFN